MRFVRRGGRDVDLSDLDVFDLDIGVSSEHEDVYLCFLGGIVEFFDLSYKACQRARVDTDGVPYHEI